MLGLEFAFLLLAAGFLTGIFSHRSRAEVAAQLQLRTEAAAQADRLAAPSEAQLLWLDADGSVLFGTPLQKSWSKDVLSASAVLSDGSAVFAQAQVASWQAMALFAVGAALVLLLPAALASWLLLSALSRRVTRRIGQIDVQRPETGAVYPELSPLMKKIEDQNEVIRQQMTKLREESTRREEMRREFTANVSHELKTPLTTISGTAEILQSGMVLAEDIPHFAGNIYHEAQRMNTLVSDILKLSQLEEGKTLSAVEPVELLSLCRETALWLHDEAERKQVSLHVSGSPATINGVRKILDEMVSNLCINSIKYNRPNGNVWLQVERTQQGVVLCVRDDGIGIPQEHQERIFERFYRVDKSHSREIGGTGLGLSIVKHAAIFHNATIDLHSREQEGTTIRILFPVTGKNQ